MFNETRAFEPTTAQRDSARKKAQNHFAAHDARTTLVKDLMAQESAANDAKTIRLRALRLAKEEADRAAGIVPANIVLKRRAPKARAMKVAGA
jgi:hypothetical protein